jgi:hypothetical protein
MLDVDSGRSLGVTPLHFLHSSTATESASKGVRFFLSSAVQCALASRIAIGNADLKVGCDLLGLVITGSVWSNVIVVRVVE